MGQESDALPAKCNWAQFIPDQEKRHLIIVSAMFYNLDDIL